MRTAVKILLAAILLLGASSPVASGVCPADFDPDEQAWVLSSMKYFWNGRMIVRQLFYQPDPTARLAREKAAGCLGDIMSFVLNEREERVTRMMRNADTRVYFLRTEDGEWQKGTVIGTESRYQQTSLAVLIITLFGERLEMIAQRIIPIPKERSLQKIIQ